MKKLLLLLLLLAAGAPARAQEPALLPAPVVKPRGIVLFDTTTARGLAISGTVRDGNGPLPGATVLIKGTMRGTSTDAQGHYLLLVPRGGRATLVFSTVGYVAQERRVGKDVVVDAVLKPAAQALSEVVVAHGVQRKLRGRVSGIVVRGNASQADNLALKGSSAGYVQSQAPLPYPARPEAGAGAGDTYAHVAENAFQAVQKEPLSTFALDVDNASYANVRRFLTEGQLPPADAVRVEEMLNYFHYDYPAPPAASPDPVRISTELAVCPWNLAHQLARIGIRARSVETGALPPANLVFLVDVSGSMQGSDCLGLVQAGLRLLVRQLRPQDRVALVAYAGAAGLVLAPTPGNQPEVILGAIERLEAGGAGLRLAYAWHTPRPGKTSPRRVIIAWCWPPMATSTRAKARTPPWSN